MSFTFSDIFKYFQYLPFVDDVVKVVHDATDSDSTKDKAADVIEDVIAAAEKHLGTSNPALAAEIAAVYALIKPLLDKMHDQPTPAPAPTPAPTVDPTTVPYDTLTAAIAALGGQYVLVIQKSDGKYYVYPNIGPLPGTQVYPTA